MPVPQNSPQVEVSSTLQKALDRRSLWLGSNEYLASATGTPRVDSILQAFSTSNLFSSSVLNTLPLPSTYAPLEQCILAIEWELIESAYTGAVLKIEDMFDNLARLLTSAAVYQANLDSVKLILFRFLSYEYY